MSARIKLIALLLWISVCPGRAAAQTVPSEYDVGQVTACIAKSTISITKLEYTNSLPLWQDGSDLPRTKMSQVVWETSPRSPSAFVSGNKIVATATFTVTPAPTLAISGARIEGSVQGLGTLVASGVSIPAGATSITINNITADTAFPPSTTQHYPGLPVKWAYSPCGKPCSSGSSQCTPAGNTSSEVYVTLAQPLAMSVSIMPLTVVKLAIGNGGASSQTEAFDITWQHFEGPANVKGWDTRLLYYYEQGIGFEGCATNSFLLLTSSTGSGQCGSWAYLFRDALAVNGIRSKPVVISPTAGPYMLVKDWKFRGRPTYPDNSPWAFNLKLGIEEGPRQAVGMVTNPPIGPQFGDLQSGIGLAGQNSGTPSEKVFNYHFIVKVDEVPDIGGPYFDPSYGATYEDNCDFEDQAIAGYGEPNPNLPRNYLLARPQFGGCSVTLVP